MYIQLIMDLNQRQPTSHGDLIMNNSRILITSAAGKIGTAEAHALRMVWTPPLDLPRLERERDHVLLRNPSYATESDEWNRTHRASGSYGVGALHRVVRRA